jgi:Na+-translocating ferredoxin:NAD+ oxidoreductase subunit B
MITALVIAIVLATLFAVSLSLPAPRTTNEETLIARIDALLPQTQCRRCTFDGCKPYATALARGAAEINQCPPGGETTARALATLLMRESQSVDPKFGVMPARPEVAWIDESVCIGCMKCIQACPVDAIVGASKYMHTIIADECTGCELCIPPCPVDCIEMRPAPAKVRRESAMDTV